MIWPNFMRLSIPFSYPEYIFSVMQSHLSQSANDLICLLLINDMSFLKPVLGSLPTVFIYQVNCASFGGGSGSTFNTLQWWKRRRGWGWRGSHESVGKWGKLRPRWNDAMRAGPLTTSSGRSMAADPTVMAAQHTCDFHEPSTLLSLLFSHAECVPDLCVVGRGRCARLLLMDPSKFLVRLSNDWWIACAGALTHHLCYQCACVLVAELLNVWPSKRKR